MSFTVGLLSPHLQGAWSFCALVSWSPELLVSLMPTIICPSGRCSFSFSSFQASHNEVPVGSSFSWGNQQVCTSVVPVLKCFSMSCHGSFPQTDISSQTPLLLDAGDMSLVSMSLSLLRFRVDLSSGVTPARERQGNVSTFTARKTTKAFF